MKKIFLLIPLFSIVISAKDSVKGLNIFTGKWKCEKINYTLFEEWIKISDTTFSGESYTLKSGEKNISEKLILLKLNDYYAYIAQPGNNHPTLFTLTDFKKKKFVFENNEHDFPQKITYNFTSDSTLVASIEGIVEGTVKRKEFHFIKVD